MGSVQSNTSVKQSVTDIMSKNIFNQISKNANSSNQNCTGNQNLDVTIGQYAELNNCPIALSQKLSIDCKTQSYFASQNEANLKSQISNSLDESFKSTQSNENPSFTLVPYSNQQSSDTINTQKYIKDIVERNLTNESLNSCIVIAKGVQNGTFTFNGKCTNSNVSFNQDMALKQYAECASTAVSKIISNDENINKLATVAASSQSNLTSSIGAIVVIIVILLIVGTVAYMSFKKSPTGMATSAIADTSSSSLSSSLTSGFLKKNLSKL